MEFYSDKYNDIAFRKGHVSGDHIKHNPPDSERQISRVIYCLLILDFVLTHKMVYVYVL